MTISAPELLYWHSRIQREPYETVREAASEMTRNDHDETAETRELRARLEAAETRIADKDAVIADLRRRLDAEAEERRKLTAMLTDQGGRRLPWWRRLSE
jgi:hypothetical protein